MTKRWWVAVVAASAVTVAACSGAGDAVDTTAQAAPTTTTSSTPPVTEAPEAPDPMVDRIVVVSLDGEVVSMDRAGANTLVHSEPGEVPFQPIWDPAGERIGYSIVRPAPALVVAAGDGTSREVADLESNPFYLYWSHDGERLASLRNTQTGLAFEIFDVSETAPSVEFTDAGAPYYFDWSPQGADLVAHVGTDRLELWAGDGYEVIGPEPGFFSAPQWLAAGVLAPVVENGNQQLAIVSPEGGVQSIAEFEGSALFEAEPSAERLVAIQTLTQPSDGVEAALQVAEPLPTNQLVVVDVADGSVRTVSDGAAAAFFWSPYGERLLYLTGTGQEGLLQWHVWQDGEVVDGPEFAPFRQWLSGFVPFFEQYARSMSLWAPDGSAYAFPGAVGDERGIWVVDAETADTELVASGIWVSWSQN